MVAFETSAFVTNICIAPPDSCPEQLSAARANVYVLRFSLFNSIDLSVSIAALAVSIQIPGRAGSDSDGDK